MMELSISLDPAIDGGNLEEYLAVVNGLENVSVHFDLAKKSHTWLPHVLKNSAHRVDVHTWGEEIDIDETVDSHNFTDPDLNSVVVMSVKCGASGQAFNPSALEKVKQIKKKYPNLRIIVDGGINVKNIASVRDAGASVAVVGNFLYSIYKDKGETGLLQAVSKLLDIVRR